MHLARRRPALAVGARAPRAWSVVDERREIPVVPLRIPGLPGVEPATDADGDAAVVGTPAGDRRRPVPVLGATLARLGPTVARGRHRVRHQGDRARSASPDVRGPGERWPAARRWPCCPGPRSPARWAWPPHRGGHRLARRGAGRALQRRCGPRVPPLHQPRRRRGRAGRRPQERDRHRHRAGRQPRAGRERAGGAGHARPGRDHAARWSRWAPPPPPGRAGRARRSRAHRTGTLSRTARARPRPGAGDEPARWQARHAHGGGRRAHRVLGGCASPSGTGWTRRSREVAAVLFDGKAPAAALASLLSREPAPRRSVRT